jgi:hypothetical protein
MLPHRNPPRISPPTRSFTHDLMSINRSRPAHGHGDASLCGPIKSSSLRVLFVSRAQTLFALLATVMEEQHGARPTAAETEVMQAVEVEVAAQVDVATSKSAGAESTVQNEAPAQDKGDDQQAQTGDVPATLSGEAAHSPYVPPTGYYGGAIERHLPHNAVPATGFPRVLTDDAPRLAYRRRKGEAKKMLHWGQRKLLFSEIEFLVNHGMATSAATRCF